MIDPHQTCDAAEVLKAIGCWPYHRDYAFKDVSIRVTDRIKAIVEQNNGEYYEYYEYLWIQIDSSWQFVRVFTVPPPKENA